MSQNLILKSYLIVGNPKNASLQRYECLKKILRRSYDRNLPFILHFCTSTICTLQLVSPKVIVLFLSPKVLWHPFSPDKSTVLAPLRVFVYGNFKRCQHPKPFCVSYRVKTDRKGLVDVLALSNVLFFICKMDLIRKPYTVLSQWLAALTILDGRFHLGGNFHPPIFNRSNGNLFPRVSCLLKHNSVKKSLPS